MSSRNVLLVGGYGAVGRHAATALVHHDPELAVVVAGRHPATAAPVAGTTTRRVDVADPDSVSEALDGVDVVLMCAERCNAQVARACFERGIHYLDVSASHQVLTEIDALDGLAGQHGATGILSVGLAPGVTNLLARQVVERSGIRDVSIGVLVGSGEHHGPAAVDWTLDGLGELDGSWTMEFPEPYGERTVHRFPFSDQYTLVDTLGLASARTGLCLDSRLTGFMTVARRPAVARLLRRPRVRALLRAALTKVHVGGDGFAVTASSGGVQASFAGRQQSRATGLTAALLIRRLPALPRGVAHVEQLVEPHAFLTELAELGGFRLG